VEGLTDGKDREGLAEGAFETGSVMPQRSIWLLKHRRAGDLAQMRNLAAMLRNGQGGNGQSTWTVEEKQLAFRGPRFIHHAPAVSWLLNRRGSDSLAPPWPDVILVAEASAVSVAKALKAQAGDGTKVIVVGRPAGEITNFDLILTTAQYGLPAAPNVVTLPLPLATSPLASAEEHSLLLERMAGKPRPWIAVLIGGSVPPDALDRKAIAQIAEAARSKAQESGGSCIVLTSPRTGKACDDVIRELMSDADMLQLWTEATESNLYRAVMAQADFFIVTSDSVSMTVEALNSGKPVSIFMLPQQSPIGRRIVSALNRSAGIAVRSPRHIWRMVSPLFASGILEEPADRQEFYRGLIARDVLAVYPRFPARSAAEVAEEANSAAVSAIRRLLA
jgi:mitochondrial fission protein ELM1